MTEIALLTSALLFGGMALYAFGFAAFVFSALPADVAGPLIRKAFPHFYLFVLVASAAALGLVATLDVVSAVIMAAIAATTVVARQVLMPAINDATDTGQKQRFKILHTVSVLITLGHIIGSAWVIVRLAG